MRAGASRPVAGKMDSQLETSLEVASTEMADEWEASQPTKGRVALLAAVSLPTACSRGTAADSKFPHPELTPLWILRDFIQ